MKFYASFYTAENRKSQVCFSFETKKLRDDFVEKTNFVWGEGTSAALTKAEALRKFGYTDSCSNRVVKTEDHIKENDPLFIYLTGG